MSEAQSTAGVRKPVCLRWEDAHRKFDWVSSEDGQPEFRWLEYPFVQGNHIGGRLLMVPSAHHRVATEATDSMLYCTEGHVEVTIGDRTHELKRFELLSIPADTPYRCTNYTFSPALFCLIVADGKDGDGKPGHLVWENYRRDFQWTLPLADQFGYHRASGPFLDNGTLHAHTAWQLAGQSTPWHLVPRDLLFVGTHNSVEFQAAGRRWPLGPRDILLMPAETPYAYTNYGVSEAIFLSIGGKTLPGKKGAYFTGDPGWPARPDAERLVTETDIYGNARVIGE